MKKPVLSILMSLMAIVSFEPSFAQNKADIIVSYDAMAPNKNGSSSTTKMSLLASPAEAKYFNDLSLWVDSLKSTPEGKRQYNEIMQKACMTFDPDGSIRVDLNKGPNKKEYTYVFTNLANESISLYGKYGEDLGYYNETLSEMQWTMLEDSTANILGYECVMAECDYHGRHWKAWFAPEIPMSFGPWKFHGLPGLILKAAADGGFSFVATGIQKTDRIMTPMYSQGNYAKVDRKKALAEAEHYSNNFASIMKAQNPGIKVHSVDKNGNKIETPKYDGLKHNLEPDYKKK